MNCKVLSSIVSQYSQYVAPYALKWGGAGGGGVQEPSSQINSIRNIENLSDLLDVIVFIVVFKLFIKILCQNHSLYLKVKRSYTLTKRF